MERTEVVIVGAGPAGLALALSLAKLKVHSVILEKEPEITRDPRAVYLTHDAVRVLWDLGLGDSLVGEIGYELITTNFHATSWANKPFYTLDFGYDGYSQALPNAVLFTQPKLEAAMRQKVTESPFCDLRCGCTVFSKHQDSPNPTIQYSDPQGVHHTISGTFLIGADGKTGIVRKHFLEPSAGIKQLDSPHYQYDGTWIAANLKLTPPTPSSHPDFPLWNLGFTPQAVYDLFWPPGWHFNSPPGKPTAAGRFGPPSDHLWRHEFAQNDWDDSMDAEALLWAHITPLITRTSSSSSSKTPFPGGAVAYPRDCIEILRCRPYRFTHRVVNRWFDGRTALVGDAAHVFPPFGGQGIASGFRDAHRLAWRLALLLRLSDGNSNCDVNAGQSDKLFDAWARERERGVRHSAAVTRMNGRLCNQGDDFAFWFLRNLIRIFRYIPLVPKIPEFPMAAAEVKGYRFVEGGFFLAEYGGGGRIAQIYVESNRRAPVLSDELIRGSDTVFTLLVIGKSDWETLLAEAQEAIRAVDLDRSILSEKSIRVFLSNNSFATDASEVEAYYPTPTKRLIDLGIEVKPDYCASNYSRRFGLATRFVIVRPDFYIFSLARDTKGLIDCLTALRQRLQ